MITINALTQMSRKFSARLSDVCFGWGMAELGNTDINVILLIESQLE